ncbi:uncharacterized protein LOC113331971 isoform X2 [Papaver somniferum]|uniref:uncharacterized protein LOC113331971 isoform X1 n=1 Tax=Papaver somniferum TaxID=3469 RepID=UPI000E703962|nr:uncharacterized protein LOC113331971 isoform X1 [Papaver somniferum]XP_026434403.1 uncharacterized protein LOC113331971 isoform X2 [Papaver somniferum]
MTRIDDEGTNPPVKSLRDYMYPTRVSQLSCIVLPTTTATYEIRASTIQGLPKFYGKENENPYYHIRDFEELCGTMKFKDLADDYLRLSLFPFSLKDKAKSWLNALAPSSVSTWDGMINLFLYKFFHWHKTIAIRQKLNSFSQQEGESLYDYLERFNDLLLQCPHHGFDTPRLTLILYEGLDFKTLTMVELLCGGNFPDKTAEEGYKFLHEVAGKTQEWEARDPIMTSSKGVYRVDSDSDSEAKIAVVSRRLELLERNAKSKLVESITHTSPITDDFSNQRISTLEGSMSLFMQATQRSMANLEQQLGHITSQLNERDKDRFPSQIQLDPKGSFEVSTSGGKPTHHVQAVTTLISGRVIDNHVSDAEENVQDRSPPAITQVTPTQKETEKGNSEISYVPRAPFPQALLTRKKGTSPNDILEVFKQVKVNIPLLDAIKQIPSYAKFLRDMCTVKRKLNVHKKAFLTEQVSSIITQKTPPKFKDPGCPTIACTIGEHRIEHALLDLGASVNLLPYSVYVQLELGALEPNKVTLQLADRSIKIPRGW